LRYRQARAGSYRKKLIARPERRFLFRLARDLGRTVGELEATLSPHEFSEWIAVFAIEHKESERAEMARKAEAGMNARLTRGR
jgi:hypothetical protein